MKTWLLVLFLAVASFPDVACARVCDATESYYVNAYADHYDVPRPLVYAIIEQESGWNRNAISNEGALGLMQLMPATARRYGVQAPFVEADNIGGGVRYLHSLLRQFNGDMRLAVAAYYAGEGRVRRRGLTFQNPAVVAYVERVRQRYLRDLKLQGFSAPREQR